MAADVVAKDEVAALTKQIRDHAVDDGPLEMEPPLLRIHVLLASAEGAEVLHYLGCELLVELHHDPPLRIHVLPAGAEGTKVLHIFGANFS